MTSPNPSSSELTPWVRRAQEGDRSALEELMRRTLPMARRIAASVVHRDQIDDAVQECYLLVCRKLKQLKKPEAFKAWFSRILLHLCYEAQRKARPTEELAENLTQESQAEHVLNALTLREALGRLSKTDRDVLILREMMGLSYEELSYTLRVPVGTVRSRLSNARKHLKTALEQSSNFKRS